MPDESVSDAVNVVVILIGHRVDLPAIRSAVEQLDSSIARDPVLGDFSYVVAQEFEEGLDTDPSQSVVALRSQLLTWSHKCVREASARFAFCVLIVDPDQDETRSFLRAFADADALADLPVIFREISLSEVDDEAADNGLEDLRVPELIRAGVAAITSTAEELEENPDFSLPLSQLRRLERSQPQTAAWLPLRARRWIGVGSSPVEPSKLHGEVPGASHRAPASPSVDTDNGRAPQSQVGDAVPAGGLSPLGESEGDSADVRAPVAVQAERLGEGSPSAGSQSQLDLRASRTAEARFRASVLGSILRVRRERPDGLVSALEGTASKARDLDLAYVVAVSESVRPARGERTERRKVALGVAKTLRASSLSDGQQWWFVRYLFAGSSLEAARPLPESGELRLRDFSERWGSQFDIYDGTSDIARAIERDRASFARRGVGIGRVVVVMLAGEKPSLASDSLRGLEYLSTVANVIWVVFGKDSRHESRSELGGVAVISAHDDVVSEIATSIQDFENVIGSSHLDSYRHVHGGDD